MNAEMYRKKMAETTDPLEKLRCIILSRHVNTDIALGRFFRVFDDDSSRSLDLKEFTEGINEYAGGELSDDQIKQIFSMVDKDGSGSIDSEEFLVNFRPPMNPTRLAIVEEAFQKLEKYMNGELELDQRHAMDILDRFDETGNQDGKVSKEEFVIYYSILSASYDTDWYFVLMIKQTWNL